MNRNPCSGCGLRSCEGECYSQCEADFEPLEEVAARHTISRRLPSPKLQLPEYAAWCAEANSKRTTVTHSDPLLKRGVA